MKVTRCLWILLIVLISSSCSSYEEQKKVESALEQSVDRFHEQLNNQQFHEIYSQANEHLRKNLDEATFVMQLKNAHEQFGTISGKAIVPLTSKGWNDLQWARVFGREQRYSHVEMPQSELIIGSERFGWTFENGEPKLDSYEFRFVCRKPCSAGIAIS